MSHSEYFKLGLITKPHGLTGEVTFQIDPHITHEIEQLKTIFIDQQNHLVPFFIAEISWKGNIAYIKLEDVNTVDDAKQISKCDVFLPKSSRPQLEAEEFYDDEIIGFQVITRDMPLGSIKGILQSGLQRLLEVDHSGKEILIPMNGPFITEINKNNKTIQVELPEGFLEI